MSGRGSVHSEKAIASLVRAFAQLAVALMLFVCLDPGRLLHELVLVGVVAHGGCLIGVAH